MSVFRIYKNNNYTSMSNYHLRDKNISLKAKGLLSVMLSLPDDWDYSINGLCSILKECQTAVKSALDELQEFGYLKITKKLPDETPSGRIEYEYNIFEVPQDIEIQEVEKQGVEILGVEFQGVENHVQLNTNKQNTKKLNTDKQNTDNLNYFANPRVNEVYIEFLNMRKDMGVKNTDSSIKRQVNELNKLPSDYDKIACIEKSINCGWRGIFAKTPKNEVSDWLTS